MPYARPTFLELQKRVLADLSAIPAVLREPLATAHGQAMHGVHGFIEWVDAQSSPLLCEEERLYDWANLYAIHRLTATHATGKITGTATPQTKILAGTKLRGQNGKNYTVINAVSIENEHTPIDIRCEEIGSAGNLPKAQELTLIDPILGADSRFLITEEGITGGAEDENLDAWRARVVKEWQVVVSRGARSGKPEDFKFWARSAHPSISGALIQTHALGIGTVIVRPFCNSLEGRLPTEAVLAAVRQKLTEFAPATADWRIVKPNQQWVTIHLKLYAASDTAENRSKITKALNALMLNKLNENAVLTMAEIDAAAAAVTLQYTRKAPLSDLKAADGEIFVLQEVLWL